MEECIRHMTQGIDDTLDFLKTTDPVKAYDFIKAHNFIGCAVDLDGIDREGMLKYVRWTNAKLCPNSKQHLTPTGEVINERV